MVQFSARAFSNYNFVFAYICDAFFAMLDRKCSNMKKLDSFPAIIIVIFRLFDFRDINLSVHGKIVFYVYILCPSVIIGLLTGVVRNFGIIFNMGPKWN